jgi:hypothetical protein
MVCLRQTCSLLLLQGGVVEAADTAHLIDDDKHDSLITITMIDVKL